MTAAPPPRTDPRRGCAAAMRRAGHGDDGAASTPRRSSLRLRRVERPEHLHAVDRAAVLARVVVEQADGTRHSRLLRELAQQSPPRSAGAEHEHRLRPRLAHHARSACPPSRRGTASRLPLMAPTSSIGRAGTPSAARRRATAQQREQRRRRERRDAHGHEDALQVRQARVAPQAAVKPERQKSDARAPQAPTGRAANAVRRYSRRYLEIEAQPERDQPRDARPRSRRAGRRAARAPRTPRRELTTRASSGSRPRMRRRHSATAAASASAMRLHRRPARGTRPAQGAAQPAIARVLDAGGTAMAESHAHQPLVVVLPVRLPDPLARAGAA